MTIAVVGLNHTTAPLETREKLALTKEELPQALEALRASLGRGVILSTCNRTEIYTVGGTTEAVKGFLASYRAMPMEELEPLLYVHTSSNAVRHLFRVASGLDSLILGESEILGQVRDAFGYATRQGVAGGPLSRMFHQALRVGKRARTETSIGRNALSVSRACVSLARQALGDVKGRSILVVGAGEAGKLAARALLDGGASEIVVANRTYQTAADLAGSLGGRAVPFSELNTSLSRADIVVSCTGSPGYILGPETVKQAMEQRKNGPVYFVDIAVPRDIDPRVKEIEGVILRDIDDLEAVSNANRRERAKEAAKVEAIVSQEVALFMDWWHSLEIVPTIAALRKKAEAIRQAEVARTLRRLPDLSPEKRESIEALSKAIVKKLLHEPVSSLRERRSPGQNQALRDLFDLDGKEE